MNNSNNNQSSSVKLEPPRAPSPVPSDISTVTTHLRPNFPSPVPMSSTPLSGPSTRRVAPPPPSAPRIAVRPLCELIDPDDQMSMISLCQGGNLSVAPNIQEMSSLPLGAPSPNLPLVECDWRRRCPSVVDRLKYILQNNDKFQDVVFDVQTEKEKEQFKAHKLILRIASPVFDEMFKNSDKATQASSSTQQYATVLPIMDVDPFIFKLLLNHIYTDEVNKASLNEYQLVELLTAALRYDVPQLYLECVEEFARDISDKVVVKLCEIASSYSESHLLDLCMTCIARHASTILSSEEFLHLSKGNFVRIAGRDDLNIDEVSLFEAAIRWAEFNCKIEGKDITSPDNLREILKDIIPLIRFPLMSSEEFTLKVEPANLLTQEQLLEIYPYITVSMEKRSERRISFNSSPRRPAKLLALESDSFSDFAGSHKSNESPERHGSVASTAIADTEHDHNTTEAESETASIVSYHSGTRNKRPTQQPSTSSSLNKKRRKNNDGSAKSRETVSMDHLFGESDGDTTILLENKTISLPQFIGECKKMKRRKYIESIIMNNVVLTDYNKLAKNKVHFPKLKHFTLNVQIAETIPRNQNDPFWEKFYLKDYLFFSTTGEDCKYGELWGTGIQISVVINKVVFLKLNPDNSHVVLNKFSGTQSIVRSLKSQDLKTIVYSISQLPKEKLPVSLRDLTLLGVSNNNSFKCWGEYLHGFKNLRELTLVCTATANEKDTMTWRVKESLPFKDKLRRLALSFTSISIDPAVRFVNVKKLYLWKTTWDSTFEGNFHLIFPQLEEVFFQGPMKASPKLLNSVLALKSLSRVISWQCDWGLNGYSEGALNLKDLIRQSVKDADKKSEKNFIISKKENGRFDGSTLDMTECQKYAYSLVGYSSIYEDVETYCK